MRYLVIGATGNIGSRVTQRLIARGERPSVFARSAKKAKVLFGDQVDIRAGDLETPRSSLAAALWRAWRAGPVRARTRTRSSTSGVRCAKAGWPRSRTG